MAHTYEELHKMTVAQLREVAVAQDSDDLDGFKSMHKAPLLAQLCKVLGIDPHEHHTATGLDKAAVKAQMRELRERGWRRSKPTTTRSSGSCAARSTD